MKIERKILISEAVVIVDKTGKPVEMFNLQGEQVEHLPVHPWIKFIAADYNGEIFGYGERPSPAGTIWRAADGGGVTEIGRVNECYCRREWIDSLIEITPLPGV